MKKGISLVVLIVGVVVISILAGIVVVNTRSTMVDMDKTKLRIDITQLESLMNTYKLRKNGNIKFAITEFDTSKLTKAELQQFAGENISNNKVQLYVIELDEIDAETVNYGNLQEGAKDRYLYSIVTGKVYYEQGLKLDDMTYYHTENGEG